MSVLIKVKGFNPDAVTVQDCIEMHLRKGLSALVNDGRLVGFKGKDPAGEGDPGRGQNCCSSILL